MMREYNLETGVNGKRLNKREIAIGGAALAVTIAFCAAVIYYWDYLLLLERYGYAGIFFISILAGGTVVVPVPGLVVVFTMGSVLHPAIVGASAGLGEAVGSLSIYLTGYGGHSTFKTLNSRITSRFEAWLQRRGAVAVFLMSAVINPLYYPFTAMAGLMHFGLVKFFFLSWAGKTVKNTVVAYLGFLGLGSLLRYIGIGI